MRPKRRTAGQGGYGYGCSLSSTRHKRSPRAVGVGGERFVGEREKRMERELAGMEGTSKMRESVCVAESRRWMVVAIRDWMIRSTEETKKKSSVCRRLVRWPASVLLCSIQELPSQRTADENQKCPRQWATPLDRWKVSRTRLRV